MPKAKTTREMILKEGYRLAVEEGMEQVQVKIIAKNLGCSVQPVYSYFKNMDDLRQEIMVLASENFMKAVAGRLQPEEEFLYSFGHAFILSAKENPSLFACFKARLEHSVSSLQNFFSDASAAILAQQKGLELFQAKSLLSQLLIYLVGLASLLQPASMDMPSALTALEKAVDAFVLEEQKAAS